MKKITLSLLVVFTLLSIDSAAQDSETESMLDKLSFLVGEWKTTSTFPSTGQQVHGDLSYKFVLGKTWIKFEFIGDHPERIWEAHGMIKYDVTSKKYRTTAFFSAEEPVYYYGEWISERTVRFELNLDGTVRGIDYNSKPDGTVYQENWVLTSDGKREITLKTDYSKAR